VQVERRMVTRGGKGRGDARRIRRFLKNGTTRDDAVPCQSAECRQRNHSGPQRNG
jgi:hypothetical protein